MAIFIPSNYSTFGDATRTEGGGLIAKYVMAQFRSDANLGWLLQLRAKLGGLEVKFKHFRDRRPAFRQDKDLWKKIVDGMAQATVVVIDSEPLDKATREAFVADGAIEGQDFSEHDLFDRACTALVAGTPIAWLPTELAKLVGGPTSTSLSNFAPDAIRQRIGPTLRAAQVFAARAHATFDVVTLDDDIAATRDVFTSPLARVILRELLSVPRTFDNENAPTTDVLNEASEEIAKVVVDEHLPHSLSQDALVREADSSALDHLQAADFAAGWAYEIINAAGIRALGEHFERVWVNGRLLKKTPAGAFA